MNLYPAIDLLGGKVVRLTRGDYNNCTVYSDHPAEIARNFEVQGASWIHVVDLEAAKTGIFCNQSAVTAICKGARAKIQFGGGIREIRDIETILSLGVTRVVLGTKALEKKFLENAILKFGPDRLAVGLDVRQDQVKTSGWTQDGRMTLAEALRLFNDIDVKTLIYTDIEKDGVLSGPNWAKLEGILNNTRARVILSGGISGLEDIRRCRTIRESNFEGAIIGKALYDKKFSLAEALEAASNNLT